MMDPLQALLQPGPLNATLFPPNSRYHGVPTATRETTDGRSVVHLRRRLVPPPDRFIVLVDDPADPIDDVEQVSILDHVTVRPDFDGISVPVPARGREHQRRSALGPAWWFRRRAAQGCHEADERAPGGDSHVSGV